MVRLNPSPNPLRRKTHYGLKTFYTGKTCLWTFDIQERASFTKLAQNKIIKYLPSFAVAFPVVE